MQKGAESLRSSLSSRLLLLTICFVMVVEVFVYVPSIAQFRRSFLEQRMLSAQIAALTLLEVPDQTVSRNLETTLLRAAGVKAVSLQLEDRRQLMLQGEMPESLDGRYNLRDGDPITLMRDTFATLARTGNGIVEIRGIPFEGLGQEVSIVIEETQLFAEMMRYSRNILLLSIIISIFTAGLVFLSINWLLVRPMRRITASMVAFSEKPDDPERILLPSNRGDEVGIAERELAHMQEELRIALVQRKRLASLGAAVSKVNHDLRNILATAHLSSDRLMMVDDPKIRDLSGRLIASIDRAIDLCERTLKYGRADEPPPQKKTFALRPLIEDVGLSLGLDAEGCSTQLVNDVPGDFRLHADPDHMFRVLLNLGRNALNALDCDRGRITVAAETVDGRSRIRLSDTGPGLPEKARENLFVPFKGSTGARGTGLGLAIVAELVEANGGTVMLEKSDSSGTTFVVELPEAPS